MKRYTFLLIVCALAAFCLADDFSKQIYYAAADGKKGAALKTALCGIINKHTDLGYNGLWDAYKETDTTPDGYVWDMYSSTTRFRHGSDKGSYSKEGDSYNREHSVPQSWFNERSPMKSDLYHVIPTDGYVNNRRSNYDFGEVGSVTYSSNGNFSKLGSPTQQLKADGCNADKVFEPNDIYKGDFARIYFYMVTCYEQQLSGWDTSKSIAFNSYPSLTPWARKMFLRWAKNDPVSQKETDRVSAAYKLQHNRNPYVDFPGLEEYVWGTWVDSTFSVSHYRNPYEWQSGTEDNPGGTIPPVDFPDDPDEPDTPGTPVVEATGDYVLLETEPADWTGQYLIVAKNDGRTCVLDGRLESIDTPSDYVPATDRLGVIAATDQLNAASFLITPTGKAGVYAIQSVTTHRYIGCTAKKNKIESDTQWSDAYGNRLAIISGEAKIESSVGYTLRFNKQNGQTRFRYYGSGQEPVCLYRRQQPDGIGQLPIVNSKSPNGKLYDLQGRPVSRIARPGVYIVGGRKVVKR